MNRWCVLLLCLLLVPLPAHAAPRCKAIDGDTLRCGRERIRLRDVHAAERGEPGAEAQRRALQRKLESGEIRIRRRGTDDYGRTLGDVYVDGRRITQADVGPVGGKGAESRTKRRPQRSRHNTPGNAPSR